MNSSSRHRSTAVCHTWMLLLLLASFSAVPAQAFRSRNQLAAVSIENPSSSYSRRTAIAALVSVPRGGEAGTQGSTEATTAVEGDVEGEAAAEEEIEDADIAEDTVEEEAEEEEEEEEEEVDVFPTDQIPSDDVRSFHTTDGEEADDEGMYTDGQNESPIAENEAAAAVDTIGAATTEDEDVAVEVQGDMEAEGDDEDDAEVVIEELTSMRTAAIIDDDLRKVLVTDLRYTNDDVSKMRPEIAREVVHNKLARPTEGMPKNWYSDPETAPKGSSLLSRLAKKKGLVVALVGTGAAALVVKDKDKVGDTLGELVDSLKSLVAMVVAAKTSVQDRISKAPKQSKETPAEPPAEEEGSQEEEEAEPDDNGIQSIKPGTTPDEVPDPDADISWLDKGITRIGDFFKSFFNMKI